MPLRNQLALAQNCEMLGYCRPRHRETCRDLSSRALLAPHHRKNLAARPIRECA
jgi:hypothetical protein